jgi:hypothetical protein
MTEPMTDEECLVKLNETTNNFLDALQDEYAIEQSIVAVLVPLKNASRIDLHVRVNGESAVILEMLIGLMQQLIPQDFSRLFDLMCISPTFRAQRGETDTDTRHLN